MPIRPELRHFYQTPEYLAARARVIERAKNRCEQCGKPNHRRVWVLAVRESLPTCCLTNPERDGVFQSRDGLRTIVLGQAWSAVKGDGQKWHSSLTGEVHEIALKGREWLRARRVRIICTVAHLNHVAGDDRDDNLKFLCQWCHLNYDKLHHRETRATRKDAARPIKWEGGIAV